MKIRRVTGAQLVESWLAPWAPGQWNRIEEASDIAAADTIDQLENALVAETWAKVQRDAGFWAEVDRALADGFTMLEAERWATWWYLRLETTAAVAA